MEGDRTTKSWDEHGEGTVEKWKWGRVYVSSQRNKIECEPPMSQPFRESFRSLSPVRRLIRQTWLQWRIHAEARDEGKGSER